MNSPVSPDCTFPLVSSTPNSVSPCNITWKILGSQTELSKCAWDYNIDAHTKFSTTKLLLDKVDIGKESLIQIRIANTVTAKTFFSVLPVAGRCPKYDSIGTSESCILSYFFILNISQCQKERKKKLNQIKFFSVF